MDQTLREMIQWLQNIEMRLFKGQKLDEETYLLKLSTMKVLKKNNELILQAIQQTKLINAINLRKLRNAAKEAKRLNKNTDS